MIVLEGDGKKMALQSFLYFAWMLDFPIERQRKRVTQPFCRCSRHAFSCGDKHRRQSQGQRQGQRHGQRQGQHAERALSCRNGYSVFSRQIRRFIMEESAFSRPKWQI